MSSNKEYTTEEVLDILDTYTSNPDNYVNATENNELEPEVTVIAAGKKGFWVDDVIVGNNPKDWAAYGKGTVNDPLRMDMARYWAVETKGSSPKDIKQAYLLPNNNNFIPFKFKTFMPKRYIQDTSSSFGKLQEIFLADPNQSYFEKTPSRFKGGRPGEIGARKSDENTVKKYIDNKIILDEEYLDHSFNLSLPFDKRDLDRMSTSGRPLFASVEAEYNFYQEQYEEYSSREGVQEYTLPDLYNYNAFISSPTPNKDIETIISLSGSIDATTVLPLSTIKNTSEQVKKYFKKWSMIASTPSPLVTNILRESEKYKNVAVAIEDLDIITEYNERKEMYPMYVDISFATERTTTVAQILSDVNLMNQLISDLGTGKISQSSQKFFQASETAVQVNEDDERTFERKLEAEVTENNVIVYDFEQWFNNIVQNQNTVDTAGITFLAKSNEAFQKANDPKFNFFKSIVKNILQAKIKQLIDREMRSYKQLMAGKQAYSETLLYKVTKHTLDGKLIQTMYLPNTNDIDVLRYVDTQVKYNKVYTYTITAIQFVIGSKYKYTTKREFINTLAATVETFPSLVMLEVPYFKTDVTVVDKPPVPPDVTFIPYRAVDNRIKINFMSNVGRYRLDPINIQPDDPAMFSKVRESQRLLPKEKILFESDDLPTVFQIFRTDEHPKAWSDFTDRLRASVETDFSPKTKIKASSAAYVDKIRPNKKYYYTFRTIDNHNHVSNPTEIYEVEMVNSDGTIYPVITPVEFVKEPSMPFKEIKKLIKISPTFEQSIINGIKSNFRAYESATDITNMILGDKEEEIWNKKFKMRLTSKATGKRMDINFRFVNTIKTTITDE